MKDAEQQPDELTEDAPAHIGDRLRGARESRGLAIEQAAAEVGLDVRTLAALEADDHEFLGAPVFVRAHLARYAQWLDLDTDALLADYARCARPAPALAPPLRRREPVGAGGDGGRWPWVSGALAVALLVGYAGWRMLDTVEAPQPVAATATAPALPSSDAAAPDQQASARAADADAPVLAPIIPRITQREAARRAADAAEHIHDSAGDPVADAAPVRIAGAVQSPPLADDADGVRVEIEFSDECWTEITDALGRRLYFGLGQAGETARLHGAPPLQVLLGDTSAVRLRVNGETYPLPDGNGQVTRLQLARRGEP